MISLIVNSDKFHGPLNKFIHIKWREKEKEIKKKSNSARNYTLNLCKHDDIKTKLNAILTDISDFWNINIEDMSKKKTPNGKRSMDCFGEALRWIKLTVKKIIFLSMITFFDIISIGCS